MELVHADLLGLVGDAVALAPGTINTGKQLGIVAAKLAARLLDQDHVAAFASTDTPAGREERRGERLVNGRVEDNVGALAVDAFDLGARQVVLGLRKLAVYLVEVGRDLVNRRVGHRFPRSVSMSPTRALSGRSRIVSASPLPPASFCSNS